MQINESFFRWALAVGESAGKPFIPRISPDGDVLYEHETGVVTTNASFFAATNALAVDDAGDAFITSNFLTAADLGGYRVGAAGPPDWHHDPQYRDGFWGLGSMAVDSKGALVLETSLFGKEQCGMGDVDSEGWRDLLLAHIGPEAIAAAASQNRASRLTAAPDPGEKGGMRVRDPLAVLLGASMIFLGGCGGAGIQQSPYPPGKPIALLEAPAHLGDNRAGSQNFPSGMAVAARVCSLVSLPEPASAYLQVVKLRNSETLSNQLTVNGRPFVLGITLERDPRQVTPLSTETSPVFPLTLDPGPSEVCLVAGKKLNGDVDDFEVDQVVLFVEGVEPERVDVRRGLVLGAPPPSYPPSQPWGVNQ